jgi:ABC-2 type transport system permease protein
MSEFPVESQTTAPAVIAETRPLYWSVRRELWENRSIYLAPLAVAAVFEFGFLISGLSVRRHVAALVGMTPVKQRSLVMMPYTFVAGLVLMTAFFVGVFYCLDALYGERRDRSILFWKSLPVSDRTTVLAKAIIPFIVLPVLVFAIVITTQLVMLLINVAALRGNAFGQTMLWTHLKLAQLMVVILYGIVVVALWHAPIYAWMLLVSSWARRAAFLWAILPYMVIAMFEKIAFGTQYFQLMLGHRVAGFFKVAFVDQPKGATTPMDPLAAITPGRFLSSPALWIGLIFAAAFLVATIRLRRYREPI